MITFWLLNGCFAVYWQKAELRDFSCIELKLQNRKHSLEKKLLWNVFMWWFWSLHVLQGKALMWWFGCSVNCNWRITSVKCSSRITYNVISSDLDNITINVLQWMILFLGNVFMKIMLSLYTRKCTKRECPSLIFLVNCELCVSINLFQTHKLPLASPDKVLSLLFSVSEQLVKTCGTRTSF